jgi:hypothetical protein
VIIIFFFSLLINEHTLRYNIEISEEDMESSMSAELVTRVLNFHGQPLQKLWDSERGEADVTKINVNVKEIDFNVYQQRQKQLR